MYLPSLLVEESIALTTLPQVAQLGVATLGLTWQLSHATDSAIHRPGDVNTPTMDSFYAAGPEGVDNRVNQLFAQT